jgi:hypothetical protein
MLCRYANPLGTILYNVVLLTVDAFQWTDPRSQNFYLYLSISICLSVCLSVSLSTVLLLDLGRFFNFLILYTVGRTPWTGDQPIPRLLPAHRTTQTQNKRTQASIPWVGFNPMTPVFEWAKTVHALERAATVINRIPLTYLRISIYIVLHLMESREDRRLGL